MARPALVTGGSRGIGRAIAVELGRRGHPVGVNYISQAEEAKTTLSLLEEHGGEGVIVKADVSDRTEVDRCFDEVEESLGPIEVLVNNAGVRSDGLAMTLSDDSWEEVLSTNLFGTFACCRRALKAMVRARWGRIVNVASVVGMKGNPGQVSYAAAKAGVVGLTKTLAREVARKQITVNAVAPGLIETDLIAGLDEDRLAKLVAEIPLRRVGTAEDVAAAVGFLCSDEASYVTGSCLVVDG